MAFEIQCVAGTAVRRSLRIARGQSFSLHIVLQNPNGTAHNGLGGSLVLRVRAPGRDSSGYQVAGNATGDYYLTARGTETRWYGDAMQFEVWFIRTGSEALSVVATSELFVAGPAAPLVEEPEIDLSSFYTMSEVDALIASAVPADVITESELATALAPIQSQLAEVVESGGSNPQIYSGRIVCRGAMSFASKLLTIPASSLTAQGLGVNYRGTLGIRVCGDTTTTGTQITRTCQFTVNHLSGGLDTPGYSRGADITIGVEPAVSGWDTTVRIASNGSGIEVLGLAPSGVTESRWTVEVWIASVVPLSIASAVDESPNVELSLPVTATSLQVPAQWALTSGITGVYVAPVAALPAEPEWLSVAPPPATVTALAQGALSVYYCGRHATGVTAFKLATTNVVLDAVAPTVDSFALSTETGSLIATVTALTASEECTYYWNFTGTLPGTPTWESTPATITLPGWGPTTVCIWARDIAGNVSAVPRSTTVNVLESGTVYFQDTFDRAEAGANYFHAPNASTTITLSNGQLVVGGDEFNFRGVACTCGGSTPANEYYVTWKLPAATLGRSSSGVAFLRPSNLAPGDYGAGVALYNRDDGLTGLHLAVVDAVTNNILEDDAGVVIVNSPPASWTSATGTTEVWLTMHVGVVGGVQSVTVYTNGIAWKRIATNYNPGAGAMIEVWFGDTYGSVPRINELMVTDFLPEYGA